MPSTPVTSRPKHVPMRRCVVCRTSRPQAELLRFHRDDAGTYHPDPKKQAGGRGVWVCRDNPECHKVKSLRRFFRAQAEQVHEAITQVTGKVNKQERNSPQASRNGGMNVR